MGEEVIDKAFAVAKPGETIFLRFNQYVDDQTKEYISDRVYQLTKESFVRIILLPYFMDVARIEGEEDV